MRNLLILILLSLLPTTVCAQRIGVLSPNGVLVVKQGGLSEGWVTEAGNIDSFQLDGSRIGLLLNDGTLLVKDGSLDATWTTEAGGVQSFQFEGSRIGILLNSGDLLVKEGPLDATWTTEIGNVSSFQLSGSRIAAVSNGALNIKDGPLNATWVVVGGGGQSFQLDGSRIGVLNNGGLDVKEGPLNATWVHEADGVQSFQLEGPRIGILIGESLLVKEGGLSASWITETNSVQDFQLDGARIGVLSGGVVSVKEGGLSAGWVQETDNVQSFQLAGNRIGVLSNGIVSVKEGDLNASWVTEDNQAQSFSLMPDTLSVPAIVTIAPPIPAVRGTKIALASTDNKFLQCFCSVGADGELHASNPNVNEEETWWFYQVGDPATHQFALANYRNNYYLQRHGGAAGDHRAEVVSHELIGTTVWTMVSGGDYGLPGDIVAMRAYDGAYLKAYPGGHNAPGERGEVYVDMGGPAADAKWNGWWRMGEVSWNVQPGRDIWNVAASGSVGAVEDIGIAIYDVFKFAFYPDSNTAPNVPIVPPTTTSCSALPPVQQSATARRVHAFCDTVTPSDYSGPFYPENDPYASQRVQCDIQAHQKDYPNHHVISQTCDISMTNGVGCEGVY